MSTRQAQPLVPAERRRKRRWSRAERERAAEKQRDDSRLYNLTLDVNALRQEIDSASQQRAAAVTRSRAAREAADKLVRSLVTQFACLFKHRSDSSGGGAGAECCTSPTSPSAAFTLEDAAFAATHMDERLALNAQHVGRARLLSQTRALSQLLQVHAVHVTTINVLADDVASLDAGGAASHTVVECQLQLTGRLTRRSIETAFPSAREHPALVSEVLEHGARRFQCSLRGVLFVERRRNVVVACELTLDVLSALHSVLPRAGLVGVSKLLDRSAFDAFGLLLDAELVMELGREAPSTEKEKRWEESSDASRGLPLSSVCVHSPRSLESRHSIAFIM